MKLKSLFCERELLFNSSMVFGASFLGAIFMFVSNIVLSRVFGPEVFGNYKTVIGLFMFLPALVDFGASPTLTKYIAEFMARRQEGKVNKLIRFFFKVKGFSLISLVGLVYVFRDGFAHLFLKDDALSYLIVPGLVLSLFIVFELTKPVIAGFQNFKLFSFSNFLTTASIGVCTVFFGYYFGVYYAILGWPLGYFIGNLPNLVFMMRKKFLGRNGVKLDVKGIFRGYALPMQFMMVLNASNLAIIPVLSLFFAQKLIGYYGFAWTFYCGLLLIPNAFASVLVPKISEMGAGNKETRGKLMKIFGLYTVVVIAGIMGVLAFSESVILLISSAYIESLLMFKVLLISGFLLGYLRIWIGYATGRGNVKRVAQVTVIMNALLFIISIRVMGL